MKLQLRTFLGPWVAGTALLAGCSNGDLASDMTAAQAALAKGDRPVAIIALKNALQKQPDAVQARWLLGKAFLDSGDAASAVLELRKAASASGAPPEATTLLARALVAQNDPQRLIDQFGSTTLADALAQADLLASLAIAHESLGHHAAAEHSLAEALRIAPESAPALILKARFAARRADAAGALQVLDGLLASDPTHAEAWRLKGDMLLLVARPEPEAAVAAYRKALALRPSDLAAHSSLLTHWIESGDFTAAAAQLAALRKAQPNSPEARYFEGLLAFHHRDFPHAREIATGLLAVAPDHVTTLQLAGATEFELKSYSRAEEFLSKALAITPGLPTTRRMLAQTYLYTGRPAQAVAALQPQLQAASAQGDAATLALAGEAFLQSGNAAKAETYFAEAARIDPTSSRSRTVLALVKLNGSASGRPAVRPEAAFEELRSVAAQDPGPATDMALIRVLLQRREFDKALAAIDALERKQPGKPAAPTLRGMVQLARNDGPAAQRSFDAALKLDPNFYPAVALLAAIDSAEQHPDRAHRRFEALLASTTDPQPALLALAELELREGRPEAAAARLGQAIKSQPGNVAARIAMIKLEATRSNPKAALAAAQDALAAIPDQPELVDALGRSLAATGDMNQAVDTFNKLARLMPKSPVPSMRLADLYFSQQDASRAASHLKRALELAPDSLTARRRLIDVQLASGQADAALVNALVLQKQPGAQAVGLTLEGDIHVAKKTWAPAAAAYRRSLAVTPDAGVAAKLHSALVEGGAVAEADKFATAWTSQHPQDASFPFYLGSAEVLQSHFPAAEKQFTAVVRLQPDNAAALNNLAWIALRLQRPGAMAYADKANQLQPGQPAYMDTLSMAFEADSQLDKAVALQRQAVDLQPQNHSLRLRLAKLYLKAGDKQHGRDELLRVAQVTNAAPDQAEATRLLSDPSLKN